MKDIFVILFSENGFDRAAQGLLGAGREIADASSSSLKVIVIGSRNETLVSEVAELDRREGTCDKPTQVILFF